MQIRKSEKRYVITGPFQEEFRQEAALAMLCHWLLNIDNNWALDCRNKASWIWYGCISYLLSNVVLVVWRKAPH